MKILILTVTALIILVVLWCALAINEADIKYYNSEIARSDDEEEEKYWRRQKAKYILRKVPILSFFVKEDEEDYYE